MLFKSLLQILLKRKLIWLNCKLTLLNCQTYLTRSRADVAKAQADLAELQATLIVKDSVIDVLSKAVTAYKLALMFSPSYNIRRLFTIRLGNLNQYSP